ncbi:MAG: hypothetical protein ACRAS9_02700 [Mycoplasma sp.]
MSRNIKVRPEIKLEIIKTSLDGVSAARWWIQNVSHNADRVKKATKKSRNVNNVILHSDHDLQYSSKEYLGFSKENKILPSMYHRY